MQTYTIVQTSSLFNMETRINGQLSMTLHFTNLAGATQAYERASLMDLICALPSRPTNADGVALGHIIRERFPNQLDWAVEVCKVMHPE